MSINRIKSLRNCSVFRNFTWSPDLHDFGRFNLIYGWNGSGKTTISRILRDLQYYRKPTHGEAALSVNDKDLLGANFPDSPVLVRVFNRDFISENVFPSGRSTNPILILGQESVQNQKRLDFYKSMLPHVNALLQKARADEANAESTLDGHCITRGTVIRERLRGPGSSRYSNYNKSHYRLHAERLVKDELASELILDDIQKEELTSQHRSSPKPEINEIEYKGSDFIDLRERISKLLPITVVSHAIDSLKDKVELSDWVRRGLHLHQEENTSSCLFCEQPMPAGRMAELEAHFSAAYEEFVSSLEELTGEIDAIRECLSSLDLPREAEFYDHLVGDYRSIRPEIDNYQNHAKKYLDSLTAVLLEKTAHPFSAITMNGGSPQLPDNSVWTRFNDLIANHGLVSQNHIENVNNAASKLESGLVAEELNEFRNLTKRLQVSSMMVGALNRQAMAIRSEISRLEVEITEHRKPAEELNDDLRSYLGHGDLQLEVKGNGYVLNRSGVPASELSEGEITAIALLYFLKSLTDHRFDLTKGVVVLDDPVSSLDANSLFLAFGFIRDRTRDAGQLIVLTHNFSFFREMRNWFKFINPRNEKNAAKLPAHFYMINCTVENEVRNSKIERLDPLLENFESDYQYLFACVSRAANSSSTDLATNYPLPNIARRLLEAFLAFRQPGVSGNLWQKLQAVDFNPAKKSQLLRFVHTYSHNDAISEPDHDHSHLSESPSVLSSLLELIEKEDPRHYDRMLTLISQGSQTDA